MSESADFGIVILEGVARQGQMRGWRVKIVRHEKVGWYILYFPPGSAMPVYNSWGEDWGEVMAYVDSDGDDVRWDGGTDWDNA